MDEENIIITEPDYPEPCPTPEQEAEWERERREREEAKIAPFLAMAQAMKDRDDLLADLLMEVTNIELEG